MSTKKSVLRGVQSSHEASTNNEQFANFSPELSRSKSLRRDGVSFSDQVQGSFADSNAVEISMLLPSGGGTHSPSRGVLATSPTRRPGGGPEISPRGQGSSRGEHGLGRVISPRRYAGMGTSSLADAPDWVRKGGAKTMVPGLEPFGLGVDGTGDYGGDLSSALFNASQRSTSATNRSISMMSIPHDEARVVEIAKGLKPIEDIGSQFPGQDHEMIRRLALLQSQCAGLLEQIKLGKRDMEINGSMGGEPQHARTRHIIEPKPKYLVEWHTDTNEILLECNKTDEVHVRMCNGTDGVLPIRITGLARSILIENCNNIKITIDALAFSSSITRCSGIQIIIGGECPSFLLRNVFACEFTLCPECMDGQIETVNCGGVVMHCVPRIGFFSLSPAELTATKSKYHLTVPSRVITAVSKDQIVSQPEGDASVKTKAEEHWEEHVKASETSRRKREMNRKVQKQREKDALTMQKLTQQFAQTSIRQAELFSRVDSGGSKEESVRHIYRGGGGPANIGRNGSFESVTQGGGFIRTMSSESKKMFSQLM